MKVLASYPKGLAKHAALTRDLEILARSGLDWTERSRRLAAAFPRMNIFSLGFVERYSFGWRLTRKGSIALEMMEELARNVLSSAELTPVALPLETTSEPDAAIAAVTEVITVAPLTPADRRSQLTIVTGGNSKAA
jgi:hypothetical protein